jgi:hypothetical protein
MKNLFDSIKICNLSVYKEADNWGNYRENFANSKLCNALLGLILSIELIIETILFALNCAMLC